MKIKVSTLRCVVKHNSVSPDSPIKNKTANSAQNFGQSQLEHILIQQIE